MQSNAIAELLAALQAEADDEAAQLDSEARLKAEAVVSAARVDAARLAREPVDVQEPELEAEAARRLAAARLDAARSLRRARERGFENALYALRARLAAVRDEESYAWVFASLVTEAIEALPSIRRVLVDPRDEALAQRTAAELGLGLVIEPALETWGGAVVDDGQGRLARNTLEERLVNAEPVLRLELARLMAALEVGVP